jgi:hypothetical protein
VPVSEVVDLPEPPRAFIAADTVKEIVAQLSGSSVNRHGFREIRPDRRMISPGSGSIRPSTAVEPAANRQWDERVDKKLFECSRS